MRIVVRSLAVVVGMAMLLSVATTPIAFAQDEGASPTASGAPSAGVGPSGSPIPDAHISLGPSTETIPFRTWAVVVNGGRASVDILEAADSGSDFSVTVVGESATVSMTLALPRDLVLNAECFDFDHQVTIGAVEPPNRLVLEVVPGGTYECRYDSECAGPSAPRLADVGLQVSTAGFDVLRPWAISVTGGRTVSFGCSPRPISALTLEADTEIPGSLYGAFRVELSGESATVEITAPQLKGGGVLVAAECEDQDSEGRLRDVLVPPTRLIFDVVPFGSYVCYVQGRPGVVPGTGTLPPTDTLPKRQPGPPSHWPAVLVLLGGVTGSLLLNFRARR